jgi:hypothetical protein
LVKGELMMRITAISETLSSVFGRELLEMGGRIRRINRWRLVQVVLVVLMATAGTLLAQIDAASLIQRFADNNRKLRNYSWTLRNELTMAGETKVALYKMRFDLDGNLQRTPMSGETSNDDIQDEILDLIRLVLSYAQPRPNRLQEFLNYASIWEGRRRDEGTIRVEGEGLNERGDSVTVLMSSAGVIPQEMKAETTYFGDKIYIKSEYRSLPEDGPVYVARILAQYPAKGIEMKLENFDFILNPTQTARVGHLVPEGTPLQVRLAEPLSTKQNQTGQPFEAVLDEDIEVDGRSVVSRKTRVIGRLVEVKRSGRTKGKAKMVLTLTTLMVGNHEIPIQTNVLEIEAKSTKGRDRKGIARSVMRGTIVGGASDGGSGAARGAVIGASTGTVKTLITPGAEVEFQPDQLFAFHFAESTEIPF